MHATTLDPRTAWVAGSDGPEKTSIELGYMALTDCASVVVAATQGFAQPYGLHINLRRQHSWTGLQGKLASGELDVAHALYGLVYAVQLGISTGAPRDMAILMGLNRNGQSLNLSASLAATGITSPRHLAEHVQGGGRRLTFAQTLPTGTHAMWLNYWLASQGIDPVTQVDTVVVPPPQMLEHLRAGRIDGCCVGEPWAAQALDERQVVTLGTSQAIWPDHPEKVLACTRGFVEAYPNTARALIMAVLQASQFVEQDLEATAHLLSAQAYLDAPVERILHRLQGRYDDGLGHAWLDPHPVRFFDAGRVNLPYLSDGMWFMTQFRRWGLLRKAPDYLAVARQVQQLDRYREAALALGIPADPENCRTSVLADGVTWDGSAPEAYARGFDIGHWAGD
jgi:ABC-type nitrate/sulfonate/bicarbonate transport system substrate-binding protein